MLLYAVGLSVYLFGSVIILGRLIQTENQTQILTVAGLLLVTGGLLLEVYKRRTGFQNIYHSISKLQKRQGELAEGLVHRTTASRPEVNAYIRESFKGEEGILNNHFEIDVRALDNTPSYQSDGDYSDEVILGFIKAAISDNRVEVRVQPIVKLPQRQTLYYELYAHLRATPTMTVSPTRYMPIAREHGLEKDIDFVLLKNSLQYLRQMKIDKPFILNIEEDSLTSKNYMNSLLAFVSTQRELAGNLIFEIKQNALREMDTRVASILKSLQRLGCRFSMDHVDDPHLDRELIRELGVSFIKLSASKLAAFTRDNNSVAVMRRIKSQLEKENVLIIAEKVENEEVLKDILDLELDYGEGYIFGRPDKISAYEPIKYAA